MIINRKLGILLLYQYTNSIQLILLIKYNPFTINIISTVILMSYHYKNNGSQQTYHASPSQKMQEVYELSREQATRKLLDKKIQELEYKIKQSEIVIQRQQSQLYVVFDNDDIFILNSKFLFLIKELFQGIKRTLSYGIISCNSSNSFKNGKYFSLQFLGNHY
ncbi:unnamed protein product [Paramecium primaurelia]|uniref:Transmembrane protein n=1 Tax=Paramecium primaurelia TaxID=5886 RepID=A0A8S1JWW5_PARPR|nr:unnamed protein product [Paramecium primaurelia]